MENNSFLNGNKKKMTDSLIQNKQTVDYKDIETLRRFISAEGKILPCRRSGLTAKNQRKVRKEIKRARCIGFLPFRNPEA